MGNKICYGAQMECSFGLAPSNLIVLPINRPSNNNPEANIGDHISYVNIMPFGLCTSLANPAVDEATAKAHGVLTPRTCIPVVPFPWTPGNPSVQIDNQPSIDINSKCHCMWGGEISFVDPEK